MERIYSEQHGTDLITRDARGIRVAIKVCIRELCTFTGMHRIVSKVVSTCDTCQRTKPINFRVEGPTTSHQLRSIMETVFVDLMESLPTGWGWCTLYLDLGEYVLEIHQNVCSEMGYKKGNYQTSNRRLHFKDKNHNKYLERPCHVIHGSQVEEETAGEGYKNQIHNQLPSPVEFH